MQTRKGMQQGQKKIQKYIYSMHQLLGKGSYASVFRGRCLTDDSPVAVKVIEKRIFANQYNLKNIHCEIEIMKQMQHQNIVKLLDVFQTNNNMYIVMEECPHGDLRNYLKKNKGLTEIEAVKLLKDIIKGFQYLHQKDIMHRDLKPANILLNGNTIKISDFGFARNLEQGGNTILNSIVGTPLYMSPQILNHQTYTNKSDLWSVGLIYYEMLHGCTPWPASSEIQLINLIKTRRPHPSSQFSERSRNFIMGCLQKKEEDRMSWEEAFNHPLITEGPGPMTIKENRTPRKHFFDLRQRCKSRSPSFTPSKASTLTYRMNRTPKSRTPLKTLNITAEQRKSPWKN